MKKQIFVFIKHIFSFIFFIVLAFGLSWLYYLWVRYPGGSDAFMHVYRLKTVAQFFPHHTWFHTWAGGMPHFIIYPTLPYLPVAFLLKLTNWTAYFTLYFSEVFTFGLLAFAIYLFVYILTGHFFLSLLSGVLILTNFGNWQILLNGIFARMWATPFMVFTWAAFLTFLRWEEKKSQMTPRFVVTILLLGLTFSLHLFIGMMTAAILGALAFFAKGFSGKSLGLFLKLGFLAFLLAAPTLLPIIFLRPPGIWVGPDVSQQLYDVTDWKLLFYWHKPNTIYPGTYTLAFYYPLLLFLTFPISIFLLFKKRIERFYRGVLISFLLISLAFFLYNRVPLPALGSFYNQFLPFVWVLSYLSFFLTFFIALILWLWLRSRPWLLFLVCLVLFFGISLAVFLQYNPQVANYILQFNKIERVRLNPEEAQAEGIRAKLIEDKKAFNFRFGTGNYGTISYWFNLLFPFIPQTRDFFFLGIVNPDHYFYIIQAGWFQKDNFAETNYLFDWWGVHRFVVEKNDENIGDKFFQRPQFYEFKDRAVMREGVQYDVFSFKNANPVMAANNSPAILVIGRQPEAHTTVFRSLAYGNFNSRFAIPVEGKEFIDDYKLEELRRFPIVFLYQSYRWRNLKKASELLKDYVSGGGRLIIEANRDLEHEARLPGVYPIVRAEKADIESWELTGLSDRMEGIDFSLFDKAAYEDGSWGIMVAEETSEDARVLISQAEKPILVEKKAGNGTVIWSGMNLPFHTIYYHNPEESKLMAKILAVEKENDEKIRAGQGTFTSNNKAGLIYETSVERVEFVHPEKRRVEFKTPAKGILFKESYFPNWKAKLNNKSVKIYKAGPGFMYVPLTKTEVGDEIEFVFGTHAIQWLGRILSIGTFFGLILYLFDWWIFAPVIEKVRDTVQMRLRRIRQWWEKDEET